MEGADSEQKAEASFLLKSGNQAAGTFDANVSILVKTIVFSTHNVA
jgi:hypothetical protein